MDDSLVLRAIKISLFSVFFVLIFGAILAWMMLNEVTASAQMSHKQKELEKRIEALEQMSRAQHP